MCTPADLLAAGLSAANAAVKAAQGKERERLAQEARELLGEWAAHYEGCEECKQRLGLGEKEKNKRAHD